MSYKQHESALVENSIVGDGSAVGMGSILRNGVRTGEGCLIGDYVVLEGPVEIADGVKIETHSYLRGPVTVKRSVVVGAHATVIGPAVIAEFAVVEPGSVVNKNVPAHAVVSGNPARIVRYQNAVAGASSLPHTPPINGVAKTKVPGVTLHQLPLFEDLRGNLSFGEVERHIPFPVRRYFLTFDVASEEARGEHAHRTLSQFLICVHGRVHIVADNGKELEEFILDRPNTAVAISPMIWSVQYRFSQGAVLLVLCSDFYDPGDYIRDYAQFLAEAGARL